MTHVRFIIVSFSNHIYLGSVDLIIYVYFVANGFLTFPALWLLLFSFAAGLRQSQPFPLLQRHQYVSADVRRGQLVLHFMLGIVRQETLDVPTSMVGRLGGTAYIDNADHFEHLPNCRNSTQQQTNNKRKRPLVLACPYMLLAEGVSTVYAEVTNICTSSLQ